MRLPRCPDTIQLRVKKEKQGIIGRVRNVRHVTAQAQMGSIVQTFSTKTIQVKLEGCKITNEIRSKLNVFLKCLRSIRFLRW